MCSFLKDFFTQYDIFEIHSFFFSLHVWSLFLFILILFSLFFYLFLLYEPIERVLNPFFYCGAHELFFFSFFLSYFYSAILIFPLQPVDFATCFSSTVLNLGLPYGVNIPSRKRKSPTA